MLVTKGVASLVAPGALINRRMYREHLERLATKEQVCEWRAKRHGNNGVTEGVTETEQPCI
jgi:hypothetical protein